VASLSTVALAAKPVCRNCARCLAASFWLPEILLKEEKEPQGGCSEAQSNAPDDPDDHRDGHHQPRDFL
jgi:hypothetical protein